MVREGAAQAITPLQSLLLRARSASLEEVGCFWQEGTIGIIRNNKILSITKSEDYVLERKIV